MYKLVTLADEDGTTYSFVQHQDADPDLSAGSDLNAVFESIRRDVVRDESQIETILKIDGYSLRYYYLTGEVFIYSDERGQVSKVPIGEFLALKESNKITFMENVQISKYSVYRLT